MEEKNKMNASNFRMNKRIFFYLVLGLLISFILLLSFIFINGRYLSSDSAYYGQISKQVIKDQKIVTEVSNLENRSVQYPPLFFVANAVFMMFLGDFAFRIILFFISIFMLAFLVKTFWFDKKKSYNLLLLAIFSAIYFSSFFFYTILRYKIETFMFFYAVVLLYLFCKAEKNYKTLILFSFFIAVQISLKQFGFIFLPFIILFAFWNKNSLKQKLKWLFLGLLIIFLISTPFYAVMKASTGFFTGVPSMSLPYLDNLNINVGGIKCGGLCLESDSLKQLQQEGLHEEQEIGLVNESIENNALVVNNLEIFNKESILFAYSQFKKGSWMLGSLQISFAIFWILIIFLSIYFKEYKSQTLFIVLLVILSLFAYIKVSSIWTYWESASFLFEILTFSFLIYLAVIIKNKRLQIAIFCILIILTLFVSIIPSYNNIYLPQKANNNIIEGILKAEPFIPENFYAISNRGYEEGYYLDRPILIKQVRSVDYIIEKDKNSEDIWQSFLDKDEFTFINLSRTKGINYIFFVKNIRNAGLGSKDIRPAFIESLRYLEEKGVIEKTYENNEVEVYSIKSQNETHN